MPLDGPVAVTCVNPIQSDVVTRTEYPLHGDAQRTNPGQFRLLQGIESDNQRSEGHKHLNTSR